MSCRRVLPAGSCGVGETVNFGGVEMWMIAYMSRYGLLSLLLTAGFTILHAGESADLQWEVYKNVSIPVPPPEHPRLFLRSRDIPDLRRRMTHPVLVPVRNRLQRAAETSVQARVEWQALQYLLDGDASLGRRTVAAMLDTLQKADYTHLEGNYWHSRHIGRMLVTAAIVYDWCHDQLQPGEQQIVFDQCIRLAKLLECGYPPNRGRTIVSHDSELMIMRDLMSAGIAMYDEFPEMYRLAAGVVFQGHIPARNWFYPGHAYHQGVATYGFLRFMSDMYLSWVFRRLGAGNVLSTSQQFIPYHWIYMRRPDGRFLASGDVNAGRAGEIKSIEPGGMLAASYYQDPYIQEEWLRNPVTDDLFELLWRDPDLQPRPVSGLPLTRYMGDPFGWMVARTGWDENSVIAEMKVNIYNFANHQHLDAGSFQIYHKGPLAIDSGLYRGTAGDYGSAHNQNYYWRTIAHNSLLVYDPDEVWPVHRSGATKNDGGQRMPNDRREPGTLDDMLSKGYKTGKVLGQWFGPDPHLPAVSYLKGDITAAYSEKVQQVQRTFVFINCRDTSIPGVMIVYDRVVASNPVFQKYWLLHSMEEPDFNGRETIIRRTADGARGKLIHTPLLPKQENLKREKIGGPGRDFWVFGENYPNESGGNYTHTASEPGQWRIQVSPVEPVVTDRFLNVLQVMDRDIQQFHEPVLLESELLTGVAIDGHAVLFSIPGERLAQQIEFRVPGEGRQRIIVTDLAAGLWQIRRNSEIFIPAQPVTMDAGVLYFEGDPGDYELRR